MNHKNVICSFSEAESVVTLHESLWRRLTVDRHFVLRLTETTFSLQNTPISSPTSFILLQEHNPLYILAGR